MNVYFCELFKNLYQKYPLILIDIGASGGINKRWECAKKYLQVIGFEPDERSFNELKKQTNPQYIFINTALHNENEEINFYLTKKKECSSFFTPNISFLGQFPDSKRYYVERIVKIKAKRLSLDLLNSVGISNADFLKVDTQGSELLILFGSSEILEKELFGIEVEVEFASIYNDQPLFHNVDDFLKRKGYQLFDLKRYFWKRIEGLELKGTKGQLIFADALYFKTYESLLGGITDLTDEQKKAKFLKALTICCIYKIYDYAMYLCKRAIKDGLIGIVEMENIINTIPKKRIKINFRGQHRLARLFYKVYKYLYPHTFYFADEEIGNE